ncbi:hypothetical protein KSP35_13105 [Aquihabitans sp. G128]|uniref:phage terminase small subunit n=1 Tax=Aquihabitans sp. G128 TaxID=2849779 RepID=UPI001C226AB1|nr:hypothetical protein [Aquihabitans sp. G128]QXC59341.1 hypothetical protein KSP35_13105 [Aquihabitans sp. G128]
MPGQGPAPKRPDRRARKNSDPIPLRVIAAEPVAQPELPSIHVEKDGELVEFTWPARTEEWWAMWAASPLSAEFTSTDWSELLDTALLHAQFWSGRLSLAAELRLRVAKFGATPEDRARLRITFAQADQAEGNAPKPAAGAKARRGPLHGLPSEGPKAAEA